MARDAAGGEPAATGDGDDSTRTATGSEGDSTRTATGSKDCSAGATTGGDRLRTGLLGLAGGLVATVVMTAFRMPVSESLPPTGPFLAKLLGGEPDDYPVAALALHLGYGSLAGGVYGLLRGGDRPSSTTASERRGMLSGLAYGSALSVFGVRAVLGRLLGMDLAPDERLVFHAGHLVYGFTLGTWVGSKVVE